MLLEIPVLPGHRELPGTIVGDALASARDTGIQVELNSSGPVAAFFRESSYRHHFKCFPCTVMDARGRSSF